VINDYLFTNANVLFGMTDALTLLRSGR